MKDDWRQEWEDVQNHRYDDFWMRGRVHPFFRNYPTKKRRLFGIEALAVGVIALVLAIATKSLLMLILPAILITIGVANIREARRDRSQRH